MYGKGLNWPIFQRLFKFIFCLIRLGYKKFQSLKKILWKNKYAVKNINKKYVLKKLYIYISNICRYILRGIT